MMRASLSPGTQHSSGHGADEQQIATHSAVIPAEFQSTHSSARLGTAGVAVSSSQIAVLACVVAKGPKGQEGALHPSWVRKHLSSWEGFHARVFWEEADLCLHGHRKTCRDSPSCSGLTVHL